MPADEGDPSPGAALRADICDGSRNAVDTVDPTPYFMKYGENTWAALLTPQSGDVRDHPLAGVDLIRLEEA